MKLRLSYDFAVAKIATVAICAVIVGYSAFLFFVNSASFRGASSEAQGRTPLQGKLTVVAADGTVCHRTVFDNQSSHIVSVETGSCREPTVSEAPLARDPDGPLGSIRKALNGK